MTGQQHNREELKIACNVNALTNDSEKAAQHIFQFPKRSWFHWFIWLPRLSTHWPCCH